MSPPRFAGSEIPHSGRCKATERNLSISNPHKTQTMNTLYKTLLLLLLSTLAYPTVAQDFSWVEGVGAQSMPEGKTVYQVQDYGAKADGTTLNTHSIQQAIDACAADGGGIVTFATGEYLTGSIYLKENVHLIIPEGVTLLGSTDMSHYPLIDTRVAGIEMEWPSALVNVLEQENVMISGKGKVDGQGKVHWDRYWSTRRDYEARGLRWIVDYDVQRPRTLLVSKSSNVTIRDLTFQKSGFWTIQLLYSSHCTVQGVIVRNNIGGHGPSTDGIDIDSSSDILIEGCDIDCNDDTFCLKAGRDADGQRVNRPTERIVIRDCISRDGAALFTCGSETAGWIRYVLAENLQAIGTSNGFLLKSALVRGGGAEHIYVRNVNIQGVRNVISVGVNWNPAYSYSKLPEEYEGKELPPHWETILQEVDPEQGIPHFHDIHLSNFTATDSERFIRVAGTAESLMEGFSIRNFEVEVQEAGSVSHARNWEIEHVKVTATDGGQVVVEDSQGVSFEEE